ncbi:MAG: phosphatidylserine decarboxylase [Clostridiales bacterium]|uniref:phosphatidylserine decarboxylase n=1 Tax=Clostridium sp. N3C TaxID=1776758 RepID=UPI00092DEEFA|nr:phosphatidylserine decarboxylase [Clostridium sp. N3C]NLZ47603.1 phosphatidylserine decarboxylase [Clostridiales bacterium]SCN23570.1 Phosphatidylserine decarboxylase proenzyme [Clostridium sp. N3C]
MIQYYNRKTGKYETEKVAGDRYLNWLYSSPVGMTILEMVVKKKFFSKLYGKYCDSKLSARKVPKFIKEFEIDMSVCEKQSPNFNSFNDFFVRKVTAEGRPVDMNQNSLISAGDGRLMVFENIDLDKLVQVKGLTYSFKELLGSSHLYETFDKGICMILRLCPTDYHRFHFIDSGVCGETNKIKGSYYSVNPMALNKKEKLFCQNKREWSLFKSDNFGQVLYVEVGATCVGSIIQSYTPGRRILKGEEKGYFKFGGSTVIIFLEKDKVKIDNDILEQSKLGYETKVNFGEKIGVKFI